ncbi:hypothetical protein [Acetoanaerobium sticklandii]|uniref:hypothetical protein n=1 Tax=Acetoanaerobium sticklandii TaxID=1511 RepID=UPI003A8CC7EE
MIIDVLFDIDKNQLYYDVEFCQFLEKFECDSFYDSIEFHNYHQKFISKVYRIFIKSNNKLLGYCYMGNDQNLLKSPYSSPFSLIFFRHNYTVKDACHFISGIKLISKHLNMNKVRFTLPPVIYSKELINILNAAFFSEGFTVKSLEINNYFDLKTHKDLETHLKLSPHKVRKNYKSAVRNGLVFSEISLEDIEIAYNVILTNREQMGYPLRIPLEQMRNIVNFENLVTRCFVVTKEELVIASAIIFDVNENVSQVVYWGDNNEYRNERPMEMLTLEVINFYMKLGKKYLDIGPSSENGIINTGLAEFKKSIGCNTNNKIIFEYTLGV